MGNPILRLLAFAFIIYLSVMLFIKSANIPIVGNLILNAMPLKNLTEPTNLAIILFVLGIFVLVGLL